MDPEKISKLARLLRSQGDLLLTSDQTKSDASKANAKLTLSASLLCALNDSFSLIVDSTTENKSLNFEVLKPNDAKSDVFRDLQFIYDFVQKTTRLSLKQFITDGIFEGHVSVSPFKNLMALEIHRVPIHQVKGLQIHRAHLQEIVCTRSIRHVKELLCECGGDKTTGFAWNELKSISLTFNQLKTVDNLEFAFSLHTLNLSHNQLENASALKWLPNLKFVDLSFNCLTRIPTFHVEACRKLQTLLLANNCIEEILDISCLENLRELDLSANYLLDHSSLLPLSILASLQYLNIQENPLACHPRHREATSRYLNRNVCTTKFILDEQALSKHEKSLTGNYENYRPVLMSTKFLNSRTSSITATPSRSYQNSPSSSVNSSTSTAFGTSNLAELKNSLIASQKKPKVRKAVIDHQLVLTDEPILSSSSVQIRKSIELNQEHLETKKQIEDLREKFGSNYLQGQAGNIVKEVVGFETSATSEGPLDFIENLLNPQMIEPFASTSTPNEKAPEEPSQIESQFPPNSPLKSDNEYESVNDSHVAELNTIYKSAVDNSEVDIYANAAESESEDEGDTPYLVVNEITQEQVFLLISERFIREKDVMTSKTKTKWGIKMLESCERPRDDSLELNFDTIKKDKRQRRYTLDKVISHEIEQYLREILAKRPLTEIQKVYKCVVCITQFSRENKSSTIECPQCLSTYVIEISESPKKFSPPVENRDEVAEDVRKSMSHSSIGSAGSLNDSSSCSKISKSESSFDSNQSVVGSTNSERDIEMQQDSDIEILSNPSQSSIEVLENTSTSRKHSSEERKISQIPTLDTINDDSFDSGACYLSSTLKNLEVKQEMLKNKSEATTQTMEKHKGHLTTVLTESSSSGSVTDSICTTYERNNQNERNAEQEIKIEEKQLKGENSVIGSVLGGILQTSNLLLSKAKLTDQIPASCEPYKYSYCDFTLIDHRLKLHLYKNIFEDEGEMLKWLVKGRIVDENLLSELETGFDALFFLSTTKFYIMKMWGKITDEPSLWLKRHLSGTIDRLGHARVLPFKIGISFMIKGIGSIHLLLSDIIRTENLLLNFANNGLPDSCKLDYNISEKLSQKLIATINNERLKILTLVNSVEIIAGENSRTIGFCAFIADSSTMAITESSFPWLSDKEQSIKLARKQPMANLVDIEENDNAKALKLNFIDEEDERDETWTLLFDTETASDNAFETISESWEKIFGVPLTKSLSNNNNNINR